MKTYTVWIEIEEHDSKTDEHQSVSDGLDFSGSATFETIEEAQAYAEILHNAAQC